MTARHSATTAQELECQEEQLVPLTRLKSHVSWYTRETLR